ncbi:jg27905, partial [Pararge aegeria aegeria]
CGCAAVGRFVCACAALREGGGAGAAADAIGGLQQLHMFAPNHINLHALVPQLCVSGFYF